MLESSFFNLAWVLETLGDALIPLSNTFLQELSKTKKQDILCSNSRFARRPYHSILREQALPIASSPPCCRLQPKQQMPPPCQHETIDQQIGNNMRREHLRLDYQSIKRQAIILTIHLVSLETCIFSMIFKGRRQQESRPSGRFVEKTTTHAKINKEWGRDGAGDGRKCRSRPDISSIERYELEPWRGDLATSYFKELCLPSCWRQFSSKWPSTHI